MTYHAPAIGRCSSSTGEWGTVGLRLSELISVAHERLTSFPLASMEIPRRMASLVRLFVRSDDIPNGGALVEATMVTCVDRTRGFVPSFPNRCSGGHYACLATTECKWPYDTAAVLLLASPVPSYGSHWRGER